MERMQSPFTAQNDVTTIFGMSTAMISNDSTQDAFQALTQKAQHPGLLSIKLNPVFAALLALYVSVLGATGIVGNTMTIVAIATTRSLQTIPNAFIMNLACSDLIIIATMTPVCVTGYFIKLPGILCKVIGPIFIINVTASMLNILSIAVNRFVIVTCRSSFYRKIYTPRNMKIHILAIYVIGITYCLPPYFGLGRYGYNTFLGACVVLAFDKGSWLYREIFLDYLVKLPTVFITMICYLAIILAFVKSRMRLTKVMVGPVSSVNSQTHSPKGPPPSSNATNEESKSRRETISVLKNLFGIWIMFILCFIPVSIAHMLHGIDHHYHHISFAMVLTNSAVNVFVYAGMNKAFRKAYKTILSCKMKCFML